MLNASPQTGDYLPLLVALIERHVRWARQPSVGSMLAWAEMPPEFAEVLRHEINNPLTGILGNAEMVLAHRERLPAAAAKRLEIVVDLAVRLRETIRRLSVTREIQVPEAVRSL
jgi:signal transduction histidine kinase